MRASIPPISESVDELHDRLLQETRRRLKVRVQALWLLKTQQCVTREAVAEALDVHRHTVTRWLNKYEEGGMEELLTIRTRPNRKRVVPSRVLRSLELELRQHPEQFSSYKDVQAWLRERHDLDIKYKTIYRLVRYELGIAVGESQDQEPSHRHESAASPTPVPGANIESDEERLARIFRTAARFVSDSDASPGEVKAAVDALADLVRDEPAGRQDRPASPPDRRLISGTRDAEASAE